MILLGPLFRHELTRLARRAVQPKLRALFAGLLLVALLVTYLQMFPGVNPLHVIFRLDQELSLEQASRFGERFLAAFLAVQLVVVVIATPVLAGGAIAEEKERRSLDFLLSSPLTSREIVLGKMAARIVFVGAVMMTGLPVLALTMFFGGVDGPTLLAGYAITALTVLSLGAYSLYLAVIHDTLRAVLVRAYGAVIGLSLVGACCGCFVLPLFASPVSTLYILLAGLPAVWVGGARLTHPGWLTLAYAMVHVPVAMYFLVKAVNRLRSPAPGPPDPRPLMPQYAPPRDDDLPPLSGRVRMEPGRPRLRSVPRLEDDEPLGWKERWFGMRIWPSAESPWAAVHASYSALAALFLFVVLIASTVEHVRLGKSLGDLYGPIARVACTVFQAALMLGAGVIAVGSVAGERQQQTLESLLTLPLDRSHILRAKARAAVRQVKPMLWLIAVFFLAGVVTGGVHPLSLLGVPVVVVGWGALAVMLGMWLSVRCTNATRATGYLLSIFLALSLLPPLMAPLVAQVVADTPWERFDAEMVGSGFGPVSGMWNALPAGDDRGGNPLTRIGGAVLAAIVAGSQAVGLWALAVERFEKEGR